MSARQIDGRIGIAELIAAQTLTLAWGRGLPAWDAVPQPEPTDATGLIDEVGRRLVTQAGFVFEDSAAGLIETADGRKWTLSATPTRTLYTRTVFRYDEAPGETIREFGLFFGTTFTPGLPAGQRYFLPAQVVHGGRLLSKTHLPTKHICDGIQNYSQELVTPF